MPASTSDICVLVVDDDAFLRAEFVDMVRSAQGLQLAGEADSLASARRWLAQGPPPDVAVIDLGLPDGSGVELIEELAAADPRVGVLVMTVFGDEARVMRALEAGANGYVLKEATPADFERAIRQVHAGESPLSAAVARHLLKRFAPPVQIRPILTRRGSPPLEGAEWLSAREVQVLSHIANGHSVPETATLMSLSPHTVSSHVKHIYDKLAVNNRTQAVNRARATGQLR